MNTQRFVVRFVVVNFLPFLNRKTRRAAYKQIGDQPTRNELRYYSPNCENPVTSRGKIYD